MEAFEKIGLIDRYIKNELTGEELALFEKQIQEEPALRKEIELQRTAIQAIKEAEIRNILRRTHQQITEEDKVYPAEIEDVFYNLKHPELERPNFMAIPAKSVELKIASKKNLSEFDSIVYEGEPNPPFQIISAAGKKTFPNVKIVPASGSKTFHYQLTHSGSTAILHLYGTFKPNELTLIYYKQEDIAVFKLRVQTKEYPLQLNKLTLPLLEENKPK